MSPLCSVERYKELLLVHLDETVPGTGNMDYETLLQRLAGLPHEVTMRLKHFTWEDTIVGQQSIRYVARKVGVTLH